MGTSSGPPSASVTQAQNAMAAPLAGDLAGWLALSDCPATLGSMAQNDPLITKATLVFEAELPLATPAVLLDFKAHENWPRALSLFVDDTSGVALLHRQGDRVLRHSLQGPLHLPSHGVLRIMFEWDGPEKRWALTAEMSATGAASTAQGCDPMPMLGADLLQMCQGGADVTRHSTLQWFGLMRGKSLPHRAPWVGTHTPIATIDGPVAAGQLRRGDLLLTEDGDYAPLMSARQMVLPSRGSFSPVLLRAPYFTACTDILVSADQLIALSGDAVEYLFGIETILTQARNLTDGRAAMTDLRHAVTHCVALDLATPQLVQAEGCRLLTHCNSLSLQHKSPPHAIIQDFEAKPLLHLLGRNAASSAA